MLQLLQSGRFSGKTPVDMGSGVRSTPIRGREVDWSCPRSPEVLVGEIRCLHLYLRVFPLHRMGSDVSVTPDEALSSGLGRVYGNKVWETNTERYTSYGYS